jgi:hypothetical protein
MGLKCSPDITKAIMENVLSDIKDAGIYIDNVGAFSNNWNHYVNLLSTVLHHLCKKMALSSTHSNENGPSKKLTGLVSIGLHLKI